MSSMLRNVGGNGTEPRVLVYQSKKGMEEIRNVVKKMTKEGGLSLPETSKGSFGSLYFEGIETYIMNYVI